jgi:hypothetical protein
MICLTALATVTVEVLLAVHLQCTPWSPAASNDVTTEDTVVEIVAETDLLEFQPPAGAVLRDWKLAILQQVLISGVHFVAVICLNICSSAALNGCIPNKAQNRRQ